MKDVLEKPAIVAGGGAPEIYISNELRQWASNMEGRAQLAVQSMLTHLMQSHSL